MIGALPSFCCQSSSSLLYSSMRLINYLISSRGLLVNESRNSGSSGNHKSKSTCYDFFIAPTDLIVQLLVPVSVAAKGLPGPHFHRYRLWHSAAGHKLDTELLD